MINEKIKLYRLENDLTTRELAEKIGVSKSAVAFWENGSSEPKSSYIVRMADFFKISTDELLGRENEATGNVEINYASLSKDEESIIGAYQSLNQENKKLIMCVIKALVK